MSDVEYTDAAPAESFATAETPLDQSSGLRDAGGGETAAPAAPSPASEHDEVSRQPDAKPYSRARTGQFARREVPPGAEPPHSWAMDVRQHWAGIPEQARQYIWQREREMETKLANDGRAVKDAEVLRGVIESHREILGGANEAQAIDSLFRAQRFLKENPREALQWLAKDAGIDLAELAGAPSSQGQPSASPFPDEVMAPLRELSARGGVSEAQAVHNLLSAHHYLESSPKEAIQWLAQHYKVDLTEFGRPSAAEIKLQQEETVRRAMDAKRLASMNVRSKDHVTPRPTGNWEDTLRETGHKLLGYR